MKKILKLSGSLYVDLLTGDCRQSEGALTVQSRIRLTAGQLKILNCLVERRGQVCPLSMLEGLVDAELPEKSVPGIKQQLSRMKNKLRQVDEGFDSRTARQVFQSVSGVGYMFQMPLQGEVIEADTPADGMTKVDMKFLKRQRAVSEQEIENLKNIFYSITGDRKVIMQAVCNNLHVSNSQYQRILEGVESFVFEPGTPAGPVYLMADGGTGKSTLLCALAVHTATEHPGWNVYYLELSILGCRQETYRQIFDYLHQNGISRTRRNLLCIDSPHENPEGFKVLYKFLLEENSPYLYVVVAERVPWMMNLLESDMVFQRNSYIYGLYLDNGEEKEKETEVFRNSHVQFSEMKRCLFPQELKKHITSKLISHFSERKKLNKEVSEESILGLSYCNKTVSDVFLDFKRNYNVSAEKRTDVAKNNYIPQITMDWDEWQIKCRPLDPDSSRLKVSEAFPYIVACSIFSIPVTYEFIREMTGYPYKSAMLRLFPKGLGESIQYMDGHFVLRHDTVADNYFSIHPEITIQSCIEEMITQEYMDEGVCINLANAIFSIRYCQNPNRWICPLDLWKLLNLMRKSGKYMEVMKQHHKIWMLELAYIALYYDTYLEGREQSRIRKVASDAFLRAVDSESDKRVRMEYWIIFFKIAVDYCMDIPESLLFFLSEISYKDRNILVQYLGELRLKDEILMNEEWNMRFLRYCKTVYEKIIQEYPEQSVYTMFFLAEIYMEEGRVEEAKVLFEKLKEADAPEYMKTASKIYSVFLSVDRGMEALEGYTQMSQELIYELDNKMEPMFEMYAKAAEEKGADAHIIIELVYAEYLKICYRYDECYKRLSALSAQALEGGNSCCEVYYSLGEFYETDPGKNPYYDLKQAAENYQYAIESLESLNVAERLNRSIPIWVSCVNTMFKMGLYEMAIEGCEFILTIEPHSQKIKELLLKSQDAMEKKR